MRRQGFITLYFDPESYAQEVGEPLSDQVLQDFGGDMNEQAGHFLGYEGWVTGWTNLPDKPQTLDEIAEEVKRMERTHSVHLRMKGDKLTGIVSDRVSGTEFDVGKRSEEFSLPYYANDDNGVYYYGSTLVEALLLGYAAQDKADAQ